MKLVLAYTFLKEIGVNQKVLKRRIEESRLYTHLKYKF